MRCRKASFCHNFQKPVLFRTRTTVYIPWSDTRALVFDLPPWKPIKKIQNRKTPATRTTEKVVGRLKILKHCKLEGTVQGVSRNVAEKKGCVKGKFVLTHYISSLPGRWLDVEKLNFVFQSFSDKLYWTSEQKLAFNLLHFEQNLTGEEPDEIGNFDRLTEFKNAELR